MDFIFMLTRGDKTVEDCLSVFDEIASARIEACRLQGRRGSNSRHW